MDVASFFTRLLQPPKPVESVKQPDDLADFDNAWKSIQETLSHPDERQLVKGIGATDVPIRLKHLVDALIYEAGQVDEDTTGSCMEYVLKNDILSELERLSRKDLPAGMKGQVLRTVNDLVVSLSERFLVHNAVHRPLRRLLRSCIDDHPSDKVDGAERAYGAADMDRAGDAVDLTTEEDLLDLMCTLTSRMRVYPPLLLIFFHGRASHSATFNPSSVLPSTSSSRTSTSAHSTHRYNFLLFAYLLRYAHREGKTGDLARAGLLFLLDIVLSPSEEEDSEKTQMPTDTDGEDPLQTVREALGVYILDGDFADVMAAGLGAIWSLLPSKLHIPTLAESARREQAQDGTNASCSGGMHLGATLDEEDQSSELRSSTDPDVRGQLDLLIKLLGFLQDIILRCRSSANPSSQNADRRDTTQNLASALADAALDAIESSFIDNVVYPSIMESSSVDGSSVAVMTYLEVIFAKLDPGPVLQLVLGVLLDTDYVQLKSKRQGRNNYYAEDGRFTLKDLILENVRSDSQSSSIAALTLLNTLLSDHCTRSVKGLVQTIRDPDATALHHREINIDPRTPFLPAPASIDGQLQETELYGSLITRIDPLQTSSELAGGYSAYLVDIEAAIAANECFVRGHAPLRMSAGEGEDPVQVGAYDIDPFQHRLSPGDPLLSSLFETLSKFLSSSPDANVALTGVFTSLALCPNRSLAGWVTYDQPREDHPWSRGISDASDSDSDSGINDRPRRNMAQEDDPFSDGKQVDLPAMYQVLRDLVRQVNRFRLDVDDFDRLLAERRQGLLFTDHLDEAMNVLLDVEPSAYGLPATPTKVRTPALKKSRSGLFGGLKAFLTPTKTTPAPRSGAASPSTAPNSTARQATSGSNVNSPFRSHYEQTTYFSLESHTSTPIASGPWSPSNHTPPTDARTRAKSSHRHRDSMSVFSPAGEDEQAAPADGPKRVTLSNVLDNCVILEEFLKEVVAVITARRALGIDQVGFAV